MNLSFRDVLYGAISLPLWLEPFLSIPEFARLRGVGLSNIDPFTLKDLGGMSRWSHSIGVAHLAELCGKEIGLDKDDQNHLLLAALLHDVGTPPFAHTLEAVLTDFDHELNGEKLLCAMAGELNHPSFPIFSGAIPQFHSVCQKTLKESRINIDPSRIARIITGADDKLGHLLNSKIDLDNADNVVRAAHLCGLDVDRYLPARIASALARTSISGLSGDEDLSTMEEWSTLRESLYSLFSDDSIADIAREALLQKIIRLALNSGLTSDRLIWNTDAGLLQEIELLAFTMIQSPSSRDADEGRIIHDLLRRYRLIETPELIQQISFEAEQSREWAAISSPEGVAWIEKYITGQLQEVAVIAKRSPKRVSNSLLTSLGKIYIMKIGSRSRELTIEPTPPEDTGADNASKNLPLHRIVEEAAKSKPWKGRSIRPKDDVVAKLDAVGDWSFGLSRNKSLHAYSSTFVHNVPACLIRALGVTGGNILDPFGGTGQTISEVCKSGGTGISSDANSLASLIAGTKLTHLGETLRNQLRSINEDDFNRCDPEFPIAFDRQDQWFDPLTFEKLGRIYAFSNKRGKDSNFLKVAFSALLTHCTERRGKNANYFADNTPLPRGISSPSFIDPIPLFLKRIHRNLDILEEFYNQIESRGFDSKTALNSVKAVKQDARSLAAMSKGDYVESFDAIITSPPYLCMTDYVLGSRLSYYWLFPHLLEKDGQKEIGRRRGRFSTERALDRYLKDMKSFIAQSEILLKSGGFLAMVIGDSTAQRFIGKDPVNEVNRIAEESGFEPIWRTFRNISWHRNGGKQALSRELILVYRKTLPGS